jgi:hypothetical protein
VLKGHNDATFRDSNSFRGSVLHPQPENCPKSLIARITKILRNLLSDKLRIAMLIAYMHVYPETATRDRGPGTNNAS